MRPIILFFCLLLLAGPNFARQNSDAAKYAKLMTEAEARKHLTILASDDYEGRETGQPGAEKAAAYLVSQFKELGLAAPVQGSYLMPVPLIENQLAVDFKVNGDAANRETDFYIQEVTTSRKIKAEQILFVGYGSDDEIGSADLRGRVLLWINEDMQFPDGTYYTGFAPSPYRYSRFMKLLSKGPAMIIAVNPELKDILKKYGEAIMDDPMALDAKNAKQLSKEALVVHVTTAVAEKLLIPSGKTFQQLRLAAVGKAGIVKTLPADIKMDFEVKQRSLTANNVLGYLEGTDLKNELVIFSAHYDHVGLTGKDDDKVFNGADDDGSGTTGLLEIAKAFAAAKKDGKGPRRSILFLANVGEEKGLLGSSHYTSHPVYPLKNTVAILNIDMIGRVGYDYIGQRDSANYVYVIGPKIMSPELNVISQEVNLNTEQLLLDHKFDDVNDKEQLFFRSDHYNFAKEGVPVIFYTDGEHDDYHKASDEIEKINFNLLLRRAKLAFYTGWELANRSGRPKAEKIKKKQDF